MAPAHLAATSDGLHILTIKPVLIAGVGHLLRQIMHDFSPPPAIIHFALSTFASESTCWSRFMRNVCTAAG
jgi:hypothetical protein